MIGKLKTAAWIAVGGLLIIGGACDIVHARRHSGRGAVFYESGEQMESERQYRRHHYAMGTFGVIAGVYFMGIGLWGIENRKR